MVSRGYDPIADGAQKVDFVADLVYEVAPLPQGFAGVLNQAAAQGYAKWEVRQTQSVFSRTFIPFRLTACKNFMEHALAYLAQHMSFSGTWNIDGRGFDPRWPLQIPRLMATELPECRNEAHVRQRRDSDRPFSLARKFASTKLARK